MMMKKTLTASLFAMISTSAIAFTPSADQIAQFQKLPKSQQEQLARQYGVDISVLTGASSSKGRSTNTVPQDPIRANAPKELSYDEQMKKLAEEEEGKLQPFGYEMFAGEVDTLTPVDNLPVPNDYVMAPGDEVAIQIYGKSSEELNLVIDRKGRLNFPEFGPIAVSGQTFADMQTHLISIIKQKMLGVDVLVSMGAMRTMQVYVVGEATQPGAYNVNGLTTVTQALIASGGIKESGSLRHVELKRKGKVVERFDVYDLLLKGDSRSDVRLLSGDTLYIPTKNSSVELDGAVKRPAIYELKGKTTLSRLLSFGGGLQPNAFLSKVNITRMGSNGYEQFTVDMSTSKGKNFIIKDGDKVVVSKAAESLNNAVALRGEVARQGAYNFKKGMKVSDIVSSVRTDLKQSADLNYALIVREINKQRDIEVLQFNLGEAIANPNSKENLSLQESDQIFVFNSGLDLEYWFGSYADEREQKRKEEEKKLAEQQLAQAQLYQNQALSQHPSQSLSPQQGMNGVNNPNVVGQQRSIETIDAATGALIKTESAMKLKTDDGDTVSKSEKLRQESREKLLTPIIDRLKSQATLDNPARLIEISGAVKYPGIYPLSKEGTIKQVISAAGGLTEQAYLDSAEWTIRDVNGSELITEQRKISLREALSADGEQNFILTGQDRVIVKTKPNWQEGYTIELQGEVVFPGTYSFTRGETLQEVIERAGGLTEYAYADGSVFSRERLKRLEEERLKILNMQLKQEIGNLAMRRQTSSAQYTTQPSDALLIADELAKTEAMGRMVISIPRAIEGDKIANLMLEKGDKLYIPARNPVISIMGEVQFTSNQLFEPNMTVEEYIEAAGGTKKQADTDRIYVVRADGSVMIPNNSYWFSRSDKPLAPGDTIIVPLDTDYLDGLSTLTSATQILYQIGVAWSAIKD
ncbi:sugar transporter [Aliivibrio finisterrensis]|uniref:Sugar transporter n=1 Tax=Aliivibrio finisterrensis TaxID=511998 RepID=A0A4Q5K700_9GAMM|nr:SLBB domain-containing protein [Aliivibrio finisterrensis]RYU41521.1 sugar transporter [Aliivibrio finisterrensis]